MDRWLALLRISSTRQVLWGTAAITAIAVAAPVLTFTVVLFFWLRVPLGGALGILAICATIPLLIAPPISFFALSVLRLLTVTIDRVDAYVRFDTLTGVLTRAYLLGQMRDQLAAAGGGAFLMVDADHFKKINDTYGHDVGDEALKRLAEVLRTTLTVDASWAASAARNSASSFLARGTPRPPPRRCRSAKPCASEARSSRVNRSP